MQRRDGGDEAGVVVPPAELVDYGRWCADRGVAPYGVPGDPLSMRAAVAGWDVWSQLRREWVTANGVADIRWLVQESSCDMVGHPDCPAASMANPEEMVVLAAGDGWIDDSMTGFADALAAAFDGARTLRRISLS